MPSDATSPDLEGPNALARTLRAIALVIAGVTAVVCIANAAPSIFGLPTLGPLPAPALRPAVFFACILAYILSSPMALQMAPKGRSAMALGLVLDIATIVITAWACWRYYTVMTAMETRLIFFTPLDAWTAVSISVVVIYLCWRAWGVPLATVAAVAVGYFFFSDHLPGFLNRAAPEFVEGASLNLWFEQSSGILGSITATMILIVFVFIVFGQLLEGTGAGISLIRVAFHLTKRFRGGPAHAAIISSGLFGTMSGNALANVVGTGVLTIPMMKRAGFKPHFAGAVEATASSAGQIMPPVMGAAAFVLADIIGMSYLSVITAAIVPAALYYLSLFSAVYFEASKQNIQVADLDDPELEMGRQDILNLSMVFVPVVVMIYALNVGFSAAGGGVFALLTTIAFSFINPEVRKEPSRIIVSIAEGGLTFARMLIAVAVIELVVSTLGATGLPTDFANLVASVGSQALMLSLLVAMLAALLLGMGMPTLPAYLTIALVLGPALRQFGLSDLSMHLFVLYYGVASSITPPVAITAFAAAAIAKAPPLKTSIFAYKVGIVKFIVPFVFVYYPVLLIVDESGFSTGEFLEVLVRVVVAIITLSSALTGFDTTRIRMTEIVLRVALALGCLMQDPLIHWSCFAGCVALLVLNRVLGRRSVAE